jgi:hypothetical protein
MHGCGKPLLSMTNAAQLDIDCFEKAGIAGAVGFMTGETISRGDRPMHKLPFDKINVTNGTELAFRNNQSPFFLFVVTTVTVLLSIRLVSRANPLDSVKTLSWRISERRQIFGILLTVLLRWREAGNSVKKGCEHFMPGKGIAPHKGTNSQGNYDSGTPQLYRIRMLDHARA